jgi:hypothetical protein
MAHIPPYNESRNSFAAIRVMIDLLKKLGYAAAIIFILMLCQYGADAMGSLHYEKDGNTHILDISHKYLPDLHDYHWIVNIIAVVLIIYIFVQNKGLGVFKDLLFALPVVFLIRALSIVSTVLPKHENCVVGHDVLSNFLNGGGCYDKIFSGHTSFVVLLTLSMHDYGLINTFLFWITNIVNCLLLLLTRAHYTVDIILGIVISYLVYKGEHCIKK